MAFVLTLFAVTAVQKNVRDLSMPGARLPAGSSDPA
jgi:hypothetical protein